MENQETAESLLEDNSYSVARQSLLTSVEENSLAGDAITALAAYLEQGNSAVTEVRHDETVILRDQESFLYQMLETVKGQYAAALSITDETERNTTLKDRQELYNGILNLLVGDGGQDTVAGRIVAAMTKQSSDFQLQAWDQQKVKLEERQERWINVAGYILNRGEREWTGNLIGITNQWKKWRVETREEISQGEAVWMGRALTNLTKNLKNGRIRSLKRGHPPPPVRWPTYYLHNLFYTVELH